MAVFKYLEIPNKMFLYLPIIFPLFFVVYCLSSIFFIDIYYKYKASKTTQSTQSVKTIYNFPFGIPWLYGLAKAVGKHRVNDQLNANIVNSGRLTVRNEVVNQFLFMTSDPENLKAILATQFDDFDLGERHKHMLPLLGDGIFTLDGAGWYHSRVLLRPQFSREQISHVIALEQHVQNALQLCMHAYKDNQFLDIQELFLNLSMDSATEFFFGESVNTLTGGNPNMPDALNFGKAFDIAQDGLMKRAQAQKLYFLINSKTFRDACNKCKDMTEYYVKASIDRVNSNPDSKQNLEGSDKYIFLDELAKATNDVNVLRDQALNLLIAGRDTVASLMSWLFYTLATNPHVFAKLREEVLSNFGKEVDGINFGSLKRCRYLQHTINETLRLYPTVPCNVRTATKDTTLPRGGGPDESSPIYIPKGANVLYHIYGVHRNPQLWGPDAHLFDPDRWTKHNAGRVVNHQWTYLPFNGGPRICLGQQYALTEASYVTVRFLQMFKEFRPAPELLDGTSRQELQLTLTIKGGVPLIMVPDV